jgi:hypothetical protein
MRIAAIVVAALTACVTQPDQPDELDDELADTARGPLVLSNARRGQPNLADAEWMAWLSMQAYQEPPQFVARVRAVAKDARVSWFFAGSTQAYYVDLGTAAVLVFRGSEKQTADWRHNFNTSLVPAIAGNVHAGFASALASVWDKRSERGGDEVIVGQTLREFLSRHGALGTIVSGDQRVDRRRLFITGHSLGGALASLAYVRAETDGCDPFDEVDDPADCVTKRAADGWSIPVHAVYTFGAPRIGDPEFARVAGSPLGTGERYLYRFVNRGDLVTQIPLDTFGYSHPHLGAETDFLIHFGHDHRLTIGGSDTVHPTSIADHDMARYIEAIRANIIPAQSP